MKQFKRDKIRMYAFLTVCLIVCILLFTVGVFADGNNSIVSEFNLTPEDILNQNDFSNSDEYISGLNNIYVQNNSPTYTNTVTFVYNNLYAYPSSVDNTIADTYISNHSNFVLTSSDSTTSLLFLIPDDCFCSYESGYFYLYVPLSFINDNDLKNNLGNEFYISRFLFSNGNYITYTNMNYNSDGQHLIDGVDYKRITLTSNNFLLLTSLPIYYNGGSAISTLEGIDNLNYSPLDDTSSSSGESELNNLYFPSSDFRFRINRYGEYYSGTAKDDDSATTDFANSNYSEYKNNWGTGNIDFSAVLTDYQKEHPEEFTLNFEFNLQENIWLDSITLTQDYSNNHLFCKYHLNCNTYTYTMGLDDFYRNGSIKTFSVQDIFSNMTIKNYSTQYNAINYPNMYVLDVSEFSNYYDFVNATKTDSHFEACLFGSDSTAPWKITCGVYLSSSNEHSGYNKESYSFISQVSRQIDDSMSDNDNPYVPSEDDSDNLPDDNNSNGSSSSSSSGGNTLINNDNDTININDGNADVVEDLYNDLTVSDGEDSLSERFIDLVNENAWITIMQETFSFIPSSIWVSLEIFVVTALGILAASFVLRIILDLL